MCLGLCRYATVAVMMNELTTVGINEFLKSRRSSSCPNDDNWSACLEIREIIRIYVLKTKNEWKDK